ncbi:unnamed protein product, partial [Heterotrigona itama]
MKYQFSGDQSNSQTVNKSREELIVTTNYVVNSSGEFGP